MQGAMFPGRPVPQPGTPTMQGGMPSSMGGTGQMNAPPVSLTTGMQPPSAPMPGAGMQNLFGQMGQPLPGGMGQLPGPPSMGPRNMGPGNMGGGAMTMPGRGVVQPNQMAQAGGMQQARQGGFAALRPANDPTWSGASRPGYTPPPQPSQMEGPVQARPGLTPATPYGRPMDGKGQMLAQQRQGGSDQGAMAPPRQEPPQTGRGGSRPRLTKPMAKRPPRTKAKNPGPDMQSLANQMYARPATR